MTQKITSFDAKNLSGFEIFNHELFGNIRTLTDEAGQIWFLGNDFCTALGYVNPRDTIRKHIQQPSDIIKINPIDLQYLPARSNSLHAGNI